MIRTPKEWDEPCTKCSGTGTLHKRERFELFTPEEWSAGTPTLAPEHDVPSNAVVCIASAGASIFEACREGVALARAYGKPVAFEFNGKVAVCYADSDPEDVGRRWWKRAFNETPEQTAANR